MAAILRSEQSFKPELVLEIEYDTTIGHAFPYVLSFCSAQQLTELWQFQNLTYFFTSWPSYLTFDQQHLQADVTYKATYVDQI